MFNNINGLLLPGGGAEVSAAASYIVNKAIDAVCRIRWVMRYRTPAIMFARRFGAVLPRQVLHIHLVNFTYCQARYSRRQWVQRTYLLGTLAYSGIVMQTWFMAPLREDGGGL